MEWLIATLSDGHENICRDHEVIDAIISWYVCCRVWDVGVPLGHDINEFEFLTDFRHVGCSRVNFENIH
jgi:hypothetical protein